MTNEQHVFSQRAQNIKISATKLMPMLASGVGDCASLGQGVPSFATPPHVIEAVCRALRNSPSAGKYSLQPGMAELRWAVADRLLQEKGVVANPETEVAITVGGMQPIRCLVARIWPKHRSESWRPVSPGSFDACPRFWRWRFFYPW